MPVEVVAVVEMDKSRVVRHWDREMTAVVV